MPSTSRHPIWGYPDEPPPQSQRDREGSYDFDHVLCFTGGDEFPHNTVFHGFEDRWLSGFDPFIEDEFDCPIGPGMDTSKSSSSQSDASQELLIPSLLGDGSATDIITVPQHTTQIVEPIKREMKDEACDIVESGTKTRKRSGTEAFSTDQVVNDGVRPRQATKIDSGNGEKTHTQFACPYQKRDPFRKHGCLKYELRRIKDVKQHLYRRHKQPDYYCAVCFHTFKTAEARDKHTRSKECDDKTDPGFEGITDDQRKALNKSTSRGLLPDEQWFRIWDIIFPGEPRPKSGSVGTYMEEMVPLLRSLWANKSHDILAKVRENQGGPLSNSDLNDVVHSIFDCLEVETSASLRIGKPAHATCSQYQMNPAGVKSQEATAPLIFFNETQDSLCDEPDGISQEIKQEDEEGLDAIMLREN